MLGCGGYVFMKSDFSASFVSANLVGLTPSWVLHYFIVYIFFVVGYGMVKMLHVFSFLSWGICSVNVQNFIVIFFMSATVP